MIFRRSLALLVAVAVLLSLGPVATTALAAAREVDPCVDYPELSPGVHVKAFGSVEASGGIAGLPDRIIVELAPGEAHTACVGFQNRTGHPITVNIEAHDVGASDLGAPVPMSADDATHGAADWLHLPAQNDVTMAHGDQIWFAIGIAVPTNAAGGSTYAAITATVHDAKRTTAPEAGTQTQIAPSVAVQVFLDIAGDKRHSGRIERVRSSRLVWWDGAGISDVPGLDRVRGSGIAPVRFDWSNTGSYTERVSGSVVITSSLSGKVVSRVPINEAYVLRDSKRRFTSTWMKDIPLIGRFTPTIELTRSDGTTVRKQLPAIWVIPAWWYLLGVILAVAIPLWIRRRSQRRYGYLLERLEAAEGAAEWDQVGPWDDDR